MTAPVECAVSMVKKTRTFKVRYDPNTDDSYIIDGDDWELSENYLTKEVTFEWEEEVTFEW